MYQPRRHLSRIHTTNCMPFIREKADLYKKNSKTGGRPAALFESAMHSIDLDVISQTMYIRIQRFREFHQKMRLT